MEAIAETIPAQNFNRHIVIIPSATKLYMSNDIPYQFRQNTDFLYLCGFQEPDSLLILENFGALPDHKSVLFVPKKDPVRELCIGGSRGGREGRTPPLGVQILSISCSFRENLACSRPPWRVHAPPSGKSWIRHCCGKVPDLVLKVLWHWRELTRLTITKTLVNI